jgi:hypothetical protein
MRPSCCGRALRWRPHNTCTKAWDTSEHLRGTAFQRTGSRSRFDSVCNPTRGSQGKIGATGFEPATFRPPAECATSVRGCRGLAFPHSHAVSVALSCPEFRADWNPEWNPGRRWTAPRYFRFRVRGEARPERIRNLVSSGATREGASASLTKSVLRRAECSSDSQLSASSRDAGTRESATAGVGHLGGLENR